MRYLLDASTLISLGLREHVFNQRTERWVASLDAGDDELAVCAITELAFVRVLAQLPDSGISISAAKVHLRKMKRAAPVKFVFISDALGADVLPAWVKSGRQTTDGHLVELARLHGARLATLDAKIPGAFMVPQG